MTQFLFKNRLYLGDVVSLGGDFQIRDFPLPRKAKNWTGIPEKIDFQSQSSSLIDPISYRLPPLLSRSDTPTKEEHASFVEQFLLSGVEKIVLARQTTLTFADRVDPLGIYSHLLKLKGSATCFGVMLSPDIAFMGATPELLFSRDGDILKTMALAGTRKHEDEASLLTSTKDLHEFGVVKEEIYNKLSEIAHPFTVEETPTLWRTNSLSHLYCPFEVKLKKKTSNDELISFLHPTPAIAGRPRKDAMKLISLMEEFDRGWYCGTFRSGSDVYVCLRTTLVIENKMHIFSGGGIVLGSKPETEWQELENKIALFGDLKTCLKN
jgi:menaquinone-specific isochorismate synthase